VLLGACVLLLAGCGERMSDDALAEVLASRRVYLEHIVALFEATPALAEVDLEEGPLPDEPADPGLAQTKLRVRIALEDTGLERVLRDRASNGLLFVAEEAGIGISGATKGLLYARVLPGALRARLVEDTDAAFAAARKKQKEGEGLDLTLLHALESGWYVYLETY
jgi:hypothetical protein